MVVEWWVEPNRFSDASRWFYKLYYTPSSAGLPGLEATVVLRSDGVGEGWQSGVGNIRFDVELE